MTLEEAKNLKKGQTVYHKTKRNANFTAMSAKVTSVKTWKRSPDKVEVHVKRGLYDFAVFNENEIDQLTVS